MANFCAKCGAPVTGQFCAKCGAAIQETARQAQNTAPAAEPVPQSAPALGRTGGTSSGAKIILILLGIVLFVGVAVVGSVVYVGYRAKQKIAQLKAEYGIENASSAGSSERVFPPSKGNGCKMLEGQEAAKVIGVVVDRAETEPAAADGSVSCRYWVSAAERQKLAGQEVASGLTNIGDPNSKSGQSNLETLIGGAAGVLNEMNGDNRNNDYAFSLQVWQKNGKQHWARIEAARTQGTNALGAGAAGVAMQSVQGVGDRAIELPAGHSIMVLKGDSFFLLEFQQFVPGQEKTAALARIVAGRV
jgi:hypothetical protein